MAEYLKCDHPIEYHKYCYTDTENAGRWYWIQCGLCGEKRKRVSKNDILDIQSVKPYDKELRDLFLNRSRIHFQIERKREYNEYLASPEWKEKRKAVITRAKNVCENCGNAKVEEVHHITYERFRNEELSDLLGVCKPCHQILDIKRMLDM